MQRKDVTISEMLSFKSDEGEIYINNLRVVIMEADAMGTLRRDLISSLGMDRAKGFLLRYGWNCGVNFAKNVNKIFSWEVDTDWFEVGVKLHSLTGNVLAVPIEIQINHETEEFYCEGHWFNSYEAEQHIKQFGYSHEAVCWSLLGWAGGFTSYYFGKKVIYKEVECKGKGDPCCRWIGRTIEGWGAAISNELPYYEEENLAFELDRAYRRIENQKEELKSILRINDQLSNVLIQGDGFSSIVKVLGQNLHTHVVLEDKNFNIMDSFGEYVPQQFSQWLNRHGLKQSSKVHRLIEEKKITHFSISNDINSKYERLIAPVLLKNEVCGYLSLIKLKGTFDEVEMILLERAATICAAQFLNERTAIETEQRIKGEFLNELLLENPNIENLSYRMRVLGYDLEKPYYVFVFDLVNHDRDRSVKESFLMEIRKKIADMIHEKLKTYEKNCFVLSRLDKIIAIIPESILKHTHFQSKSIGEWLVHFLSENFTQFKIILGISSLCTGIRSFYNGYQEATKSIEMAHSRHSQVICFNELGSLGQILLYAKNQQELEKFANSLLKELVLYDKQNDGQLLMTLYYFFENQGNIHGTAREMMISIGAIRYRLKRVQEITNLDLTNSKVFFDTHLALQILLYYGIFKI